MNRIFVLLIPLACIALIVCAMNATADESDPPVSAVGPLLKILQSDNLPEDRLAFIFDIMADKGNAYDLGVLYAKAMGPDGYQDKTRAAALKTLADAGRQRGVKPEGDLSKLSALLDAKTAASEPVTYDLAIELAGLWRVEGAAVRLAALVSGKETSSQHRTLALNALVNVGGDDARAAIDKLTADKQPQSLRYLGGAAMVRLDVDAAAPLAVKLLSEGSAKDDPAALVDAFLQQQNGAEKLAAAVGDADNGQISADVAKLALRHVYSVGRSDQALVDALSKAAGISAQVEPPSAEELQAFIADVQTKGDASRGESIFRRADMNCIKCHTLNGAGGTVGPDLVDLGGRQALDYLVESILLPEKAVKEEYQLARVTDFSTGKQYQGILKEESNERIVLKDAEGKQVVIAIDDPDEIAIRKGGSLMPQGLVRFLTRDETVDLVKFLSALGLPDTPYAKETSPIIRRYRVLSEVPAALAGEEPPDDEAIVDHVLAADESAFRTAYAKVDGRLPVSDFAGEESPIAYLQFELDVTATGDVGIEIEGCKEAAVWVDAARQKSGKQIQLSLDEGRHVVTLRLPTAKCGSDGLRIRLTGEGKSTASIVQTQ